MKKLYSLILCATVLTLTTSAQTGGTYTAVLSGNWHSTTSSIWTPTEPPSNCGNCLIVINVPTNQTITLNTHVTLYNGSQLIIGGGSNGTTLFIPNSGSTDSLNSYGINLINDGTNSAITLANNNSFVNVASNNNHQGDFDGLFTSYVSGGSIATFKQVGYAPNGFFNGTIVSTGDVTNHSLTGPITLSATGTLPILLSNFTAALNDGAVDLAWSTQLEINSDHFTVQRSSNSGASWDDLGSVTAHGNSTGILNYSFTDTKPGQGTNEYRLQLVDRDGKYTYSDVKSVRIGIVTAVSLYPNPAHDYVNVTLSATAGQSVLIRLFNQNGQVLIEKNVTNAGGTTVPLAVSSYPEGNYIIVVSAADGSRQVNKLVITK